MTLVILDAPLSTLLHYGYVYNLLLDLKFMFETRTYFEYALLLLNVLPT